LDLLEISRVSSSGVSSNFS